MGLCTKKNQAPSTTKYLIGTSYIVSAFNITEYGGHEGSIVCQHFCILRGHVSPVEKDRHISRSNQKKKKRKTKKGRTRDITVKMPASVTKYKGKIHQVATRIA